MIIIVSAFPVLLSAQTFYPTDSSFIQTLTEVQKQDGERFQATPIDSTITNFQNYLPRNTNGNLGLPSTPLLFNYQNSPLGFVLYNLPYNNDVFQQKDVTYFKTKGPYASLTGIAGSKQEQLFKFLFSNSFKNNLNITLAFNRYSGNGFYKRQQSFTNNFYTSSNYMTKNKRFGFDAYGLLNKLKHQENGGISNDSLLRVDETINKLLLPFNLSIAKREFRDVRMNAHAWYRLNKTEDSTTQFSQILNYTINYTGFYTKYTDDGIASDNYYHTFYLDTISTKDSTHWRQISNLVNYNINYKPLNLQFNIGVKNEYNQLYQFNQTTFINNSLQAGAFIQKKIYAGNIKAEYLFSGSNANDYQIEFKNKIHLNQNGSNNLKREPLFIKADMSYESRHPNYMFNQWFSNNFQWSNHFSSTQKLQTLLSINVPKQQAEIGFVFQNINNALYFNEQALPMQTHQAIQNINLFAKKNTLLFNHLGINAQYNYQHSSYQAITSLPNHSVNGALYYQGNLFKKALQLQIGFQANYYNAYNGLAYMPATNIYYTQTHTTVGDYTFIDFFLNARIKPVRIFIKIDHLNQGFMGSRYNLVPNYWQNDRAFKFGINWLFFD